MVDMEILQRQVMEHLDLSRELKDEELMEVIHQTVENHAQKNYLTLREKANIGKELFNCLRKLDILQELLEDEEITEIMINGTDHIFIERDGRMFLHEKRFTDRRKLEDVIQQIVAGANRVVNESTPIVDARLADGSRVNVVLYPVALNGPIVTIRKFPRDVMTMEQLIRKESLNREIANLVERLVVSRYNIFLSGGTGSG